METIPCTQCEKNRTALKCGICTAAVCKTCAQILEPEAFAFAIHTAPELKQGTFCIECYQSKVAAPLDDYFEVLEVAKNIDIFFKKQGKETRLVRRTEKPVTIPQCDDRDDVVMSLAFEAARGGFDSVIDIDLKSEKVRDGSYQRLLWRGTGVPANTKGKVLPTNPNSPN